VGSDETHSTPVQAKTVLIDPVSMTVLWMNESAARDLGDQASGFGQGMSVVEAVPLAEVLGLPTALREAAETGVAQHLSADLVSTSKGRMAIVASAYRMPEGKLLLVIENAWQAEHRARNPSDSRRHRHPHR
jgi:hypothetical protein